MSQIAPGIRSANFILPVSIRIGRCDTDSLRRDRLKKFRSVSTNGTLRISKLPFESRGGRDDKMKNRGGFHDGDRIIISVDWV